MAEMKKSTPTSIVEVVAFSGFDKALAYAVPPAFRGEVVPGSLVRVPLRRRSELGVVLRLGTDQSIPPGKLKMLYEVVQEYPVLTAELLDLFRWAVRYYASSPEAVLEAMIPAAIRRGMKPKKLRYMAAGASPSADELVQLEKRAPRQAELLRFIQAQLKPQPRAAVLKRMGISVSACQALLTKGWLIETDTEQPRIAYEDELDESTEEIVATRPTLTD